MTHPSAPWLSAIAASSSRLAAVVEPLTVADLGALSFAADWTVAQVLSHLGSAAEISTTLLERGVAGGTEGPQAEQVRPVWARWDAMTPADQRAAWLEADGRHREVLAGLDPAQLDDVRVPYFSGLLDVATYAGYRLSEQSVHAWDIEVSLDDDAVIPDAEVDLLLERVDLVATRFRDGDVLASVSGQQVAVDVTDRDVATTLDLGAGLHMYLNSAGGTDGTITGTAEELLRLVYGRHRPGDSTAADGGVSIELLRRLFPGY